MSLDIDPAALLRLCTVPRLGSRRIRSLISCFKTPDNVFSASIRQLVQVEGIEKTLALGIKKGGKADFVHSQLAKTKQHNVDLLTFWDTAFPKLLKQVNDPPLILFYRGNINCLENPAIGIVGTRIPSTYGKLMADKFARELAGQSVVVVSGLARGIDTIAHRATVRSSGQTVAVLGSGLDQIYPDENKKLAVEIIENGIVLSEFPMGAKPDAPHFPRRNRIISGLSYGILVVEAGKKSGALITADFALEQNRDVFVVPGNINNPGSYGPNTLAQQGAKIILSVDDILEEIGQSKKQNQKEKTQPLAQLSEQEKRIYNILSNEPKHIDLIASECHVPTSQALGILLTLELKDVVQQLVGKNFIRNG